MRIDRRLLWLTILVLLLAGAAWAIWSGRADDATYARVTRGPIEQAVETAGVFQPVETAVVRGRAPGIVEAVAVRPGDRVQPGDIVATLERTPFEAQVEQARRAVEEAELAATLARERAATGTEADVVEAALAAARADAARAALAEAEAGLESALLVAPVAGTVLEVPIAAGEPYAAGGPAAVIGGDAFELAATLDQADLPLVDVGAEVRAVPDALPELELLGRVAEIAPRGEQEGGAVRFDVRVALAEQPSPDRDVRPGMTARLTVPAVTVEDAVLVPAAAIETVGRRSFVRVLRDGEEVTVEVSPGLRQGGMVQVAAGDLEVGERVRVAG